MSTSRRDFLKATGLTALGVGAAAPIIAASMKRSEERHVPSARGGSRLALRIDTKMCDTCQNKNACIDACHTEHNVPGWDGDEEIKWIWREEFGHVFEERVCEYSDGELKHKPVLVLCNHCDEPSCVRVCPTQATFKREDGPVMMDQHRCIGCRYCIVGCPYGARSFNYQDPRNWFDENGGVTNPNFPTRTKGVVEKCTLCTERLARGLEPACVAACHEQGNGGMIFGDLEDESSAIRKVVSSSPATRRKVEVGNSPQVYYAL